MQQWRKVPHKSHNSTLTTTPTLTTMPTTTPTTKSTLTTPNTTPTNITPTTTPINTPTNTPITAPNRANYHTFAIAYILLIISDGVMTKNTSALLRTTQTPESVRAGRVRHNHNNQPEPEEKVHQVTLLEQVHQLVMLEQVHLVALFEQVPPSYNTTTNRIVQYNNQPVLERGYA